MPSKPAQNQKRLRPNHVNFDRMGYLLLESFRHQALVLLQMGEIGRNQWTTINEIICNTLVETGPAEMPAEPAPKPGVVQQLRRAV